MPSTSDVLNTALALPDTSAVVVYEPTVYKTPNLAETNAATAAFAALSYDAIKTLCTTSLQYQTYKNGSIVFLQSEVSNSAYILLNGCMSIWISKNGTPTTLPEDNGTNLKSTSEEEENRIEVF